ncbi:HIT-like protein [Calocera viscosa TUFC12733]|uniref:HIT-like protein n=1 Tax=Calocera viscosa (strain TUFC12733) TaxID=1330018 RepID=A0A167FVY4_CALVF|nr:HIT-like protein [Calocera viscosa TUFC12733]
MSLLRRWFPSWFASADRDEEAALAGQINLPPTFVKGCVFCDVRKEKGFNIVHETEDLIIFKDRSPAATEHLLVIPRHHLASVKALRKPDIPLVRKLEAAGADVLTTLGYAPSNQRFGFHIPPFNSINHLHLHAFGLPYRSRLNSWKFPIAVKVGGKGLSWFVEIAQVYDILGKDGKVTVLPC